MVMTMAVVGADSMTKVSKHDDSEDDVIFGNSDDYKCPMIEKYTSIVTTVRFVMNDDYDARW